MKRFFLIIYLSLIAGVSFSQEKNTPELRSSSASIVDSPIFIVDGVRSTKHDVWKINPDAIKKIEVLKDPSDCTLYGSSAELGVIKITTHKKKEKKTRIICFASTNTQKVLYVVDGNQFYDQKMPDIDPSSIKEMKVLKDTEATVLYGAKAKNGVVVVTTNKK